MTVVSMSILLVSLSVDDLLLFCGNSLYNSCIQVLYCIIDGFFSPSKIPFHSIKGSLDEEIFLTLSKSNLLFYG